MPDTATLPANFQISIPKAVCQQFAFIPKGTGVLLVPVPSREDRLGIAKGTNTEDYRDREDRFC
jgi:hypothetical protein